jgi:2-dehydro-3-deoxyphosphogluconate aldolase / (4S)-4-hydroxy-2-oxoglutarate aldolase
MTFTKQQIVDTMRSTGLVPLFTHDDPIAATQVLEAAYRGGVRTFEFTNRRKNSFEIFSQLVEVAKKYPDLC